MKKTCLLLPILFSSLLLSACVRSGSVDPVQITALRGEPVPPTTTPPAQPYSTATMFKLYPHAYTLIPIATQTFIPLTLAGTLIPTPITTPSPTLTETALPSPQPTRAWNPPGAVKIPILLYHHVANIKYRYAVSPEAFRTQMERLHDWGYTTITMTQMVNVLVNGGYLPARPIVITFDDGYQDVYENAFPIMHELGLVGVTYIIASRLDEYNSLHVEQIKEMVAAGWEVGSHSLNHIDLKANQRFASREIKQSREILSEALGVPVNTFAYPFGVADDYIKSFTQDSGYLSGMGLGESVFHTLKDQFYLSRREVEGSFDLNKFISLLPWNGTNPRIPFPSPIPDP